MGRGLTWMLLLTLFWAGCQPGPPVSVLDVPDDQYRSLAEIRQLRQFDGWTLLNTIKPKGPFQICDIKSVRATETLTGFSGTLTEGSRKVGFDHEQTGKYRHLAAVLLKNTQDELDVMILGW